MGTTDDEIRDMFVREAAAATRAMARELGELEAGSATRALGRHAHRLAGAARVFGHGSLADAADRVHALDRRQAGLDELRRAVDEVRRELRKVEGVDELGIDHGASSFGDPTVQLAVLHVEDEPTNRLLVKHVLAGLPNVELREAVTGSEALELATTRRPDLVLVDVDLPDVDGAELVVQLRALPCGSRLRIVGVTAHSSSAVRERLLAAGADDVLTKPLDIDRVLRLADPSGGD